MRVGTNFALVLWLKRSNVILNQNKIRKIIPLWVLLGTIVILAPIFVFITLQNINRQIDNNVKLLIEKGAALIRSFEAGTRAGIFDYGETRQLQKLLYETAKQPDIKFLLVADSQGKIIAHSDFLLNGEKLNLMIQGQPLDISKVAGSNDLYWQIVDIGDGKPFFLLFRKFAPLGTSNVRLKISKFSNTVKPKGIIDIEVPERIILAAFDITSILEVERLHARNVIITGVVLFIASIIGVCFVFFLQGYRSTRTSLSRIKVFSNTLVQNLPIGLVALNHKYKVVMINNFAKSILLIDENTPENLIDHTVLPETLYNKLKTLNKDNKLIEENIDCEIKNGQILPLEISASILRDHEKELSGYICLFKDLSEVQELKKEVERSRRLVSVGKLAAGVAHEIRNPLSSIKGFATYFKERYQDVAEDQQIAAIMIQEVDRLNLVVGQLLEFARPVKISVKNIEIKPFFETSLKLIELRAEKAGVQIISNLPEAEVYFGFDPDKISQVLLNVYINAIDAMERGGALSINVLLSGVESGLIIQIGDTGSGILEEDLEHIFDPYFTTKSAGTGLGLAISHNIIEQHGGDFIIESQSGEGTIVTVNLPGIIREKNEY